MIKQMQYTKDNGDVSDRKVIVISKPRTNYLVYDVSKLTEDQIQYLEKTLQEAEEIRNSYIAEFEQITGKTERDLWRSFKPEGIEWITGNEI